MTRIPISFCFQREGENSPCFYSILSEHFPSRLHYLGDVTSLIKHKKKEIPVVEYASH